MKGMRVVYHTISNTTFQTRLEHFPVKDEHLKLGFQNTLTRLKILQPLEYSLIVDVMDRRIFDELCNQGDKITLKPVKVYRDLKLCIRNNSSDIRNADGSNIFMFQW